MTEVQKYNEYFDKLFGVSKPMPKLTESLENGVYVYRDPSNKVRMLCGPDTRNAIRKLQNESH